MSKNAWQNLGLAALTAAVLASVVWLFAGWPPQTPGATAQPLPPLQQQAPEPVAVFLGDSYTEGTGASTPARRWTSLVADEMGWFEVNKGEGGTGYSTAGSVEGRRPYPPRAAEIAADVIVVAGGQNDFGQPTRRILDGIDATFTVLRKHNPQAQIIAVSPTAPVGEAPPQLVRMRDAVQAAAQRVDAEFVDATTPNWMNAPGVLAEDGVHPNDRGHAMFAHRLVAALN